MSNDAVGTLPATGIYTNAPKVEDGKFIKRLAISTAAQASSIADGLVMDDVGRDRRRAELQGALNGNAPYNERVLREKNQGHRFNVCFGYLEGACGRAYSPYLDMGEDEEFLAKINADLPEQKKMILRDEFVKAVRRWGFWPSYYNCLVRETVDFGYCTANFPDPISPWWIPCKQRDGLTFARSLNLASKLDVFVWRRSYLIHELYDHVADEEAASIAGWEIENVWNALQNAAPDDYVKTRLMGGLQIYQEAIRAAALALSYGRGAKKIDTYHVYCRELSGKVSQWITLDTSGSYRAPETPASKDTLLFHQNEQFESMDDVLVRFDLEYGDGYWHGSKGLAQKLYSVHKAHDRLMNSGLDQTFRGGLGILKALSQKAHESIQLEVTSDFVVLSPDYEATPGVKMPTIQPEFFSMDAALLATAVQRGGDVAPEAMGIERQSKTATQSTYDQQQKQVITKANMKRWVPQLSNVIDKMLRRLLNRDGGHPDAVRFCDEIFARGITVEDIAKIKRVDVFHTVEDVFGETRQNISFISDKYRLDPDANTIALKQKEVGAWLGPQASLEIIPGDASEIDNMKASRDQTLEISAILDGNMVPVAPDDLHPIHVTTIANYLNHISQLTVAGQTQTKRFPNKQDMANLIVHAEQHIEAEGSIKGKRESARALEGVMQESIQAYGQAQQIAAQKHAQALQTGLAAGMMEATGATGTPTPPPGVVGASENSQSISQAEPSGSLLEQPVAA